MFDYQVSKHPHFDEACRAFALRHNLVQLAERAGMNVQILRNKLNPAQPHLLTAPEIWLLTDLTEDSTLVDGFLAQIHCLPCVPINEVAKEVHVESHVLRYWEEELGIPITRNRQGHRIYTQEDIKRFIRIKNLKDQGLQLKAVKLVLNQLQEGEEGQEYMKQDNPFAQKQLTKINKNGEMKVIQIKEMRSLDKRDANAASERKSDSRSEIAIRKREELKEEENQQEKLARMQYLLQKLIADAVRSNNQTLVDELSSQMKENICKEMDYQFRLLEEHEEERETLREAREEKREKARRELEEEHYKKIDAMLRNRREKSEKSKNKENVLFRVLSKSKA